MASHRITIPIEARGQRVQNVLPDPSLVKVARASGALPFLILGALSWTNWQDHARLALLAYGACILSFVGALHWAFAMTASGLADGERTRLYVWSIVPSLLARASLLLPQFWGIPLLLAGLWAHFLQDRRLVARTTLQERYLPLRLGLTGAASLGLLLAWPTLV